MYFKDYCAGVDEVGRGPLAGDVYAAAVVLNPFICIEGLRDSKALSPKRRSVLAAEIKEQAIGWCIETASVAEIDRINILQASLLAMQRAVAGLACPVDHVVVDGNRCPRFNCPADFLVKGDSKLDAIKAASIIAKVARDEEMMRLDLLYPGYGLAQHKGYPTRDHLEALKRLGPSAIHRLSFGPCRTGAPSKSNKVVRAARKSE